MWGGLEALGFLLLLRKAHFICWRPTKRPTNFVGQPVATDWEEWIALVLSETLTLGKVQALSISPPSRLQQARAVLLLIMQSDHRLDPRRAACGYPAGSGCYSQQKDHHRGDRYRITRSDAKEKAAQQSSGPQRREYAQ